MQFTVFQQRRTLALVFSSDPTLTTYNVVEMTRTVKYDDLRPILNTSYGKCGEILEQYQSDEQRCEALIAYTLSTHPCWSWNMIAAGLQRRGFTEAAAEVTRKYVKGEMQVLLTLGAHAQRGLQ